MTQSYTFGESINQGSRTLVCRAQRREDGLPVVIKRLRPEVAREAKEAGALCLRREYDLLAKLDLPGVVKVLDLTEDEGGPALVMEDIGGEGLHHLLARTQLSLPQFLALASGLADTISGLHRQGIIHKDINPRHIIYNQATGQFRLTGFAIAEELAQRVVAPRPPAALEGSLAYISPEQTGRTNRALDYRTDFYSLGATCYHLLTGVPPFAAADELGLLHCHIALQPLPPHEHRAAIPGPLSDIVMKLLAKTAEERYQTADGLHADLERCAAEWQAQGGIAPFPLGLHDVPGRLLLPLKMYGRQREVGTLLAAFDQVAVGGKAELWLVAGYSGIGKSAVVNEVRKALVPSCALFAGGKFDQYQRDIPYATLAQALQALVRQVLGASEEEIAAWRQAMLEAVGSNGRLVTDLVPDLVALIGEQPPVQDVPPQDAQNRFNTVFSRLLNVFARPERPLVLFLDDLQWIDAATLQLLDHLFLHLAGKHILLLGAYRDNETGPSHPLMLALDSMHRGGAAIHSIALAPLTHEDVLRLTADALHCEDGHAEPLAGLLYEKTGGNPFFTTHFLTMLADEGLVRFDGRTACWQWDLERIRGKGFTGNVAELMVGKLSRLQPGTQNSLQRLACLGAGRGWPPWRWSWGERQKRLRQISWRRFRRDSCSVRATAFLLPMTGCRKPLTP
jgi:hypothetical protein